MRLRPSFRKLLLLLHIASAGAWLGIDVAFPPVVSTTAVLVAMALSVFKPWGRLFPARRLVGSASR